MLFLLGLVQDWLDVSILLIAVVVVVIMLIAIREVTSVFSPLFRYAARRLRRAKPVVPHEEEPKQEAPQSEVFLCAGCGVVISPGGPLWRNQKLRACCSTKCCDESNSVP
jgi:hypothetical protein